MRQRTCPLDEARQEDNTVPVSGSPLSSEEITRYSRHLLLPEIGLEGQLKLKRAKVLIAGAGGLGCPASIYLAAAGVGRLGLADYDTVEASNLQRQVLYGSQDVGRPKLEAAAEHLVHANPNFEVIRHDVRLVASNILDILEDYDLVIDGSDNFPTRFLLNDACVRFGKPYIYGSVYRFEGQVAVFDARRGPCYRCLYPSPPESGTVPNCAEGGVLGLLPGIVGLLQATEAVKLILSAGAPLIGRVLVFDALAMSFREIRLAKDARCSACGPKASIERIEDFAGPCGVAPARVNEITPLALRALLDNGAELVLLDVRQPAEVAICSLPGSTAIPMNDLPSRLRELDPAADTVVYCRSGVRSAQSALLLQRAGFARVRSLAGGIGAWARLIDPTMPEY